MVSEIEQYYQENFISPFLDSVITRVSPVSPFESQERVDGDTRNSGNGFSLLLDTLLNHITHNCTAILESSRGIRIAERPAFRFLLVSIWSPIVSSFFQRIPAIFVALAARSESQSCGSHALFQRNFLLADHFVAALARLAPSPRAFWQFPATRAFQARWEISS